MYIVAREKINYSFQQFLSMLLFLKSISFIFAEKIKQYTQFIYQTMQKKIYFDDSENSREVIPLDRFEKNQIFQYYIQLLEEVYELKGFIGRLKGEVGKNLLIQNYSKQYYNKIYYLIVSGSGEDGWGEIDLYIYWNG